jgi:hypothetical protein
MCNCFLCAVRFVMIGATSLLLFTFYSMTLDLEPQRLYNLGALRRMGMKLFHDIRNLDLMRIAEVIHACALLCKQYETSSLRRGCACITVRIRGG